MSFKTLFAYQKGFSLAMDIFHLTKGFPKSELFGLSSQMIRSSRAVCSAIAEGYRKDNMKNILKVSFLMQIAKIQKPNYG